MPSGEFVLVYESGSRRADARVRPGLHPREMQDCTFNFSGKARRFRSLAPEKAPMQLQVFRGEEDKKTGSVAAPRVSRLIERSEDEFETQLDVTTFVARQTEATLDREDIEAARNVSRRTVDELVVVVQHVE